jgi:hypothetical protein
MGNELGGSVHALHRQAMVDQVPGHRLPVPTTEVEYSPILREQCNKSIKPRAFVPPHTSTILDVPIGMPFIEPDDRVRE